MQKFFKLIAIAISIFFLQSCIVSKTKYDDMLAQKVRMEGALIEKSIELDSAESRLKALTERANKLKQDTALLGEEKRNTARRLAELNKEYDQLNTFYKNLLNSAGKQNREMAIQKDQLLAIQDNLDKTRRVNDSLSTSLAERERKVKELETILSNKDRAVQDLKNKISNALLNYKENDLTVHVKNGKVYVSLAEQLLFGSGSIEIDAKGVSALQQLAKAIKDHKDIQIMVEGHTDDVPIGKKSQYMQDNWDLSVMRATSVSKILTGAGVSPKQITAAGKGEFVPLVVNSTDPNRQKNRRTEIIITPHLDEIFKILDSY